MGYELFVIRHFLKWSLNRRVLANRYVGKSSIPSSRWRVYMFRYASAPAELGSNLLQVMDYLAFIYFLEYLFFLITAELRVTFSRQ